MSVAQAAPPQTQVRFRHRRRPPAIHFGIIGAVFLIAIALGVPNHVAQGALVLAALGAVGLGWLGRDRLWVEDQLLTDTSAVIVHADGALFELPYDEIERVSERRNAVVFVRRDGAGLHFNRNPHAKRIRRVLSDVAPQIGWVKDVDPACDT